MKKYVGELEGFFETGTEGVMWTLLEDDQKYYGVLIEKGDHLTIYNIDKTVALNGIITIYNVDKTVAFNGIIRPDWKAGWTAYPKRRPHRRMQHFKDFVRFLYYRHFAAAGRAFRRMLGSQEESISGQPTALGYWIHWTQRGWNPDEWAALFFGYDLKAKKQLSEPLRGVLVKRKEHVNRIVFSEDLKHSNIYWYFNEQDVNHYRLDGIKRPNTIPDMIVAAKTDGRTLVFNTFTELAVCGKWAILQYRENSLRMKLVSLRIEKSLIKAAYRDEEEIYTAD